MTTFAGDKAASRAVSLPADRHPDLYRGQPPAPEHQQQPGDHPELPAIFTQAGHSHGLGNKVVDQHEVLAAEVGAERLFGNVPQTISQSCFTIGHWTGNGDTSTGQVSEYCVRADRFQRHFQRCHTL